MMAKGGGKRRGMPSSGNGRGVKKILDKKSLDRKENSKLHPPPKKYCGVIGEVGFILSHKDLMRGRKGLYHRVLQGDYPQMFDHKYSSH